ncbi:MAG: methionine--tRNA ligase [Termitinemataceae bacterium]|nr:MAG: methionine--tRNA ligase [Termitinemataceae bacterium]
MIYDDNMKDKAKKKLITSALPYVNNVPHLGNIIQVLSADCFARFCRLRGYETLYVCGTDEYGTATETRAAEEGCTPRCLCDRYWEIHNGIYEWFNIAFDKFGRTSTPIQSEIVQDVFKKLDAGGFIKEQSIEQLYCPKCERFLADRYVLGTCPNCAYEGARGDQCESCGKLLDPTDLINPVCSSCKTSPQLKSTKHLYIDLPSLKGRLEAWIANAQTAGRWANNAVQMTHSWIRDGLHERAITRDLKWGIPVPKAGYENKVFYVWFDAPIGYLSITGAIADEVSRKDGLAKDLSGGTQQSGWKKFVDYWWKDPENTELFQFIGKDNIPFHTVIFPCSQLGTGEKWTMLHHMSSTEYLNYESGKFSKSKGIGVFGSDARKTGIAADIWRFYIYYNRPEKSDALFTWKDFGEKTNAELIGNLGNFVNRTLSFVTRYYDGIVPEVHLLEILDGYNSSAAFWQAVQKKENEITEKMEWAELRDSFHLIFDLSSFANKTFQDGEPWKKRSEEPEAARELIGNLCYLVRDLAVLCAPFIPEAAEKIAGFFGLTLSMNGSSSIDGGGTKKTISWNDIGKPVGLEKVFKTEVLFTKLEDEKIMELREKYSGTQKEREANVADAEDLTNENSTSASTAGGSGKDRKPCGSKVEDFEARGAVPPAEPLDIRFAKTVDLRVAKIVSIEKHPKADKLYIEKLDIAGEERTIVSGLVPYYSEADLLGRHIIVVYNLKAAKLRGIESKGMLLAASFKDDDGEHIEVIDAKDVPTGTRVVIEGGGAPNEVNEVLSEIDIDTFFSIPILTKDFHVQVGGKNLSLCGIPLETKKTKDGEVG